MKKLGLIGGIGPESTLVYYKEIEYGVMEKVGKPFLPPLTIESMSCFEVIPMSVSDLPGLTEYILFGIKNLAAAGCEVAAMTGNTPHIVFDQLQERSPIPLISIVEVARDEALRRGYKKVGLLGTAATMKEDFFKKPFVQAGIEVIVPPVEDQAYVADHIENELEHGIVKEETAARILSVTDGVAAAGAEALVLGCTELPMIFDGRKTPIPTLDTMRLHIEALIDAILEK